MNFRPSLRLFALTASVVTLAPVAAATQPLFAPPVSLQVGPGPTGIATGDVNGDGRADAVVANQLSATVTVLVSTGTTLVPAQTLPVGGGPHTPALGDVDGDGLLDLAVSNSHADVISLHRGLGTGQFVALGSPLPSSAVPCPSTPTGTCEPLQVVLADVTGDGALDLIAANQRGRSVTVRTGDGLGGFGPLQSVSVPTDLPSIVAGDLNGDSRADVIASQHNATTLVFLGSPSGLTGPTVVSTPDVSAGMVVSDLDGDGDADVVRTLVTTGQLQVLRGDGLGNLAPDAPVGTVPQPFGVTAADVDQDGLQDLVVAGQTGTVALHRGAVGGALLRVVPDLPSLSLPQFVAAGDVTGDGYPDLMVTAYQSNAVGYYANHTNDGAAPTIACDSADGLWHATDVVVNCTATDLSGLANAADAAFTLSTAVAVGTETANASTDTRAVCDRAGNCGTAGPVAGHRVDTRAPSIAIATPSGGAYLLNQPVTADYTCVDGGSGVATCAGSVPSGGTLDTSTAGARMFTVSSTDAVGNSAMSSAAYTVRYAVCLLYDPEKSHKSGSTVPLKIQLCDAGGQNHSSGAVPVTATSVYMVSTNAPGTLEDAGNANPDFNFRYDATLGGDGGYIFNLKLTGYARGTYALTFSAGGDPVPYVLQFQVR